jgi:hypothetical protein
MERLGEPFARDMGKLVEAYVGRQLAQLDHDVLIPELRYGKGGGRRTCDWVLSIGGLTIVFEVKAARIAHRSRLGAKEHVADMLDDVGKALKKQLPATVKLIRDPTSVYAGYELPSEVCAVVVTAEPHLRINRRYYRGLLPDPGVPYVVLSLADLEWLIAAALAGMDMPTIVRELTTSETDPQELMSDAADEAGVRISPNPMMLWRAIEEVAPSRRHRRTSRTMPVP